MAVATARNRPSPTGRTYDMKGTPVLGRIQESIKNLKGTSTIIEYGGAGSSKSYSIAQLILMLILTQTGLRIAVGRKFFPSHKTSAMFELIEMFKRAGIYNMGIHNKTDHTFEYRGNYILFFSTGSGNVGEEKIKSANFNIIWMEEASEFSWDEYLQFTLRLRSPLINNMRNFIILSLNPVGEYCWVKTELIDKNMPDVIVHHSTYMNNKFLDDDYVKYLENMINLDYNTYQIYTLGKWGRLENLIITNWEIVDRLPEKWTAWQYGLDWGYVHPTALIKVVLTNEFTYWHESICESKLTNADIIERLSHLDRGDIQADPSRPDAIEEIRRAGYAIFEANNDVKHGLDLIKRRKIRITRDSVNLIKQVQEYHYMKDKNGVVREQPAKFKDDCIDAARYATTGMIERYGYATSSGGRQSAGSRSYFPVGMY